MRATMTRLHSNSRFDNSEELREMSFEEDIRRDIEAVSRIDAVPMILDVVCRTTNMGFAAVARVTEQRWVCCSSLDHLGLGLTPGRELQIETTICNEIR